MTVVTGTDDISLIRVPEIVIANAKQSENTEALQASFPVLSKTARCNFQDFPRPPGVISRTFRDLNHFPRLSRAWKFGFKKSVLLRTFQEAWEPCL